MKAFVKTNSVGVKYFDYDGFEQAIRLATRMGSRITNVDMFDPDWDTVQKRDRLLGVSLTGQVEAWDELGWGYEFIDGEYYFSVDPDITDVLTFARITARDEADRYHQEMNIPRSLLVTTGKPSGSVSQIPTVSSGCHRPYSPYYFRRIRVSKNDPIAKALRDLSVPVVPENGQGDDLDSENCNTWVFTFAVKTAAPIRAIDEPAIDQLERYKQLMTYYIEHNQSITVTVNENEWEDVIDWFDKEENWNSFVGVSFLPKWDPQKESYPNLPYQPCTAEEYQEFISTSEKFTEQKLIDLINYYETEYEEYDLDANCGTASGFCPTR